MLRVVHILLRSSNLGTRIFLDCLLDSVILYHRYSTFSSYSKYLRERTRNPNHSGQTNACTGNGPYYHEQYLNFIYFSGNYVFCFYFFRCYGLLPSVRNLRTVRNERTFGIDAIKHSDPAKALWRQPTRIKCEYGVHYYGWNGQRERNANGFIDKMHIKSIIHRKDKNIMLVPVRITGSRKL